MRDLGVVFPFLFQFLQPQHLLYPPPGSSVIASGRGLGVGQVIVPIIFLQIMWIFFPSDFTISLAQHRQEQLWGCDSPTEPTQNPQGWDQALTPWR